MRLSPLVTTEMSGTRFAEGLRLGQPIRRRGLGGSRRIYGLRP